MNRYLKVLSLSFIFLSSFSFAEEGAENTTAAPSAGNAAATSVPDIPRSEPDIDQTIISNLIKNTPPEAELLQLDTSKSGEKLIALYQAESSGVKQGGIIIFPDDKTHLDWPGDLNHLREGLTEYGWHTLAIYLPQIEPPGIPERTLPVLQSISAPGAAPAPTAEEKPAEEATPEPPAPEPSENASQEPKQPTVSNAPEEAKEPYHEQALRRGQTAHTYLQQQETERVIVMGIGTGAIWATQYVKQFQGSQELRLVMIDAQQPIEETAPDLLKLLPEIETTIIDLHHSSRFSDSTPTTLAAERRLKVARQNTLSNFHQSRLPATRDDWKKHNPWLLKHVRGLLNTYVIKAELMPAEMESKNMESAEQGPGAASN